MKSVLFLLPNHPREFFVKSLWCENNGKSWGISVRSPCGSTPSFAAAGTMAGIVIVIVIVIVPRLPRGATSQPGAEEPQNCSPSIAHTGEKKEKERKIYLQLITTVHKG